MAIEMKKLQDAVATVRHPEINNSLVELGMIDDLSITDEGKVSFTLLVPMLAIPIRDMLINMVAEAIAVLDPDVDIEVAVREMTEEQKMAFFELSKKNWAL